jgi:hypothetical protein
MHARATTGETREIDARVVATVHEKLRLLEVRPRVAVDSAAADISILVCTAAAGCADVTDA